MLKLPPLTERIARLIGLGSVSSADPDLDQSNRPVIDQLAEWAETVGFQVEIDPVSDTKANLIARLGGSLDAEAPGGLILSGHTDTVPCNPELWQSDPWQAALRDDRIYGLGACDMKGFFAVALEAARRFEGIQLQQPLILIGTADEESSMSGARQLMHSGRRLGRRAIIGEPTGLRPIRMHKGVMMERIRVIGRSGHSSDPALGANALNGMAKVLNALIDLQDRLKEHYRHPGFEVDYPTLNLGAIRGGDNPNRICGCCETAIDIRPLPGMSLESTRALLEETLNGLLPESTGLRLEIASLFPGTPAFETPAEAELTRVLEDATGHSAGSVAFGTEGPFFSALGLETLILGPGHIAQAHQPNEYLALADIPPAVRVYESLIQKYCLTARH